MFSSGKQFRSVIAGRLRLRIAGQTFVKESLPVGQSAAFTFRVSRDADQSRDSKTDSSTCRVTSVLAKMLFRWLRTVPELRPSRAAMASTGMP